MLVIRIIYILPILFSSFAFSQESFSAEKKKETSKLGVKDLVSIAEKKEDLSDEERDIKKILEKGWSEEATDKEINKIKKKHAYLRFKREVTRLEIGYENSKETLEKDIGLRAIAFYKKSKDPVENLEAQLSRSVDYYTMTVVNTILSCEAYLKSRSIDNAEQVLEKINRIVKAKVLNPVSTTADANRNYDSINHNYRVRLRELNSDYKVLKKELSFEAAIKEKELKEINASRKKHDLIKKQEKQKKERALKEQRRQREREEYQRLIDNYNQCKKTFLAENDFSNARLISSYLDREFHQQASEFQFEWNKIKDSALQDYKATMKYRSELPGKMLNGAKEVGAGVASLIFGVGALATSPVWFPAKIAYDRYALLAKNKNIFNQHVGAYYAQLEDTPDGQFLARNIKKIFISKYKLSSRDDWWNDLVEDTEECLRYDLQEKINKKSRQDRLRLEQEQKKSDMIEKRLLRLQNDEIYDALLCSIKEQKGDYTSQFQAEHELNYSLFLTYLKKEYKDNFQESTDSSWENSLVQAAKNRTKNRYTKILKRRKNSLFGRLKTIYEGHQENTERKNRLTRIIENISQDEIAYDEETTLSWISNEQMLSSCFFTIFNARR